MQKWKNLIIISYLSTGWYFTYFYHPGKYKGRDRLKLVNLFTGLQWNSDKNKF